jgi:hypothetical protein
MVLRHDLIRGLRPVAALTVNAVSLHNTIAGAQPNFFAFQYQ